MAPLCFAYYCSGHGYGHATRVSAFASHLLSLPQKEKPCVYICSSAPEHVFADSIKLGALYRYAEIDPVIVQPVAYRVDRQKSVDVLKTFLSRKDTILDRERQWLIEIKAHAVLSDAAFLGCLAAKEIGIPSVLITNFTFDSVYSYLSTPLLDTPVPSDSGHLTPVSGGFANLVPDIPVALSVVEPLVEEIVAGYRCADLLFLLPGHIPIPSFSIYPPLPAQNWVDPSSNQLLPAVVDFLSQDPSPCELYPSISSPVGLDPSSMHTSRSIIPAPLLVRSPSLNPSVYSSEGRSRLLSSIGVPVEFHDPSLTRILVVSFGGQVFRAPSRSGSRSQSRSATPIPSPTNTGFRNGIPEVHQLGPSSQSRSSDTYRCNLDPPQVVSSRLATPSHLWIPGAPPASKPIAPAPDFGIPELATIPPTPSAITTTFDSSLDGEHEIDSHLLPDSSWIAIVCGVSKDQWLTQSDQEDLGLPPGFYVAPKEVYMPDLTAIADVLLGKLGYGTVSECVDSRTPFVYVSRPLFIEEHGLRLLLGREGVGIELSRQAYEAGDWAASVEEAWIQGKACKLEKRAQAAAGLGLDTRKAEGLDMAKKVVSWARDRCDYLKIAS